MTDKKFTDEEIIKRLERCVKRGNRNYNTDIVLDLINRQKAEIERLKEENKIYNEANRLIAYQRDQRDKEIDALHEQITGLSIHESKIKAESYKEFAEKLKGEIKREKESGNELLSEIYDRDIQMNAEGENTAYDNVDRIIDNLLKEMVSEND